MTSCRCRQIITAAIFAAALAGDITAHAAETTAPADVAQASNANEPPIRFDASAEDIDIAVEQLVGAMTLEEKIGQMCQVWPEGKRFDAPLREAIKAGKVGSIINAPDAAFIAEAQRIAREESRLGIPLLVGRDVIHGYRTVFPIPLGQAASWNPELVERAATIAASEASCQGINWTFAPMVDICRDPRWGRIAESLGEDPILSGKLAAAMVRGLQQEDDGGRLKGIVACAKHFAGYGLSEGGRDYNRASLSALDLRNVILPPFHAAVEAGCRTLMTTFSEVNGAPGTANGYLLRDVLRRGWKFRGFVVSDWNSVIEMVEHGFSQDIAEAAKQSVNAGLDMEMVSPSFQSHLKELVEKGEVSESQIDKAVRRILRVKMQAPCVAKAETSALLLRPRSLEVARKLARESLVLLKNDDDALPLKLDGIARLAVIGPLADAPQSQLGCWAPDGKKEDAVTPLDALRYAIGESAEVLYEPGAEPGFSNDAGRIKAARDAADKADAVVLFVGEDALLSGEAHSRAELGLPGIQSRLVREVAAAGKPTVLVILAGRPLTIGAECDAVGATLYAWHPGTMGGPAIADILLGHATPSGKLPVTFPKAVGQIPLYYGHTNTGRPSPAAYRALAATGENELPQEAQFRSHYLDSDPFPLFPFGFGLSYTTFAYDDLELSNTSLKPGQTLGVRVRVANTGKRAGAEVVQLYIRDVVAQPVRPVRELKAFRRIHLRAHESKIVEFALDADDLAYLDEDGRPVLQPGKFMVWVGGDSQAELGESVELLGGSESGSSPAVARSRTAAGSAPQISSPAAK